MFGQFNAWHESAVKLGLLATEAQSVVAYRMLGFSGLWSVPPSESIRMVAEKTPAFLTGWWDASQAWGNGASPEAVLVAWAEPLEEAARENRQRLARRGPKVTLGLETED
ncbi:antifreeze protein [Salipiger abyssi]|uniref:Antifreeze protein n=1 Tax=Salipiger abyssi TaxID=1250539 RepID=A0A1P8UWB5_9RHOB|nr:antifreeze protein [Salipiger abyssi]APZ53681.1 hypothetical protein Ga0080574_TMP3347 [Salipiger abyssi]